jgi:hypothetical protein
MRFMRTPWIAALAALLLVAGCQGASKQDAPAPDQDASTLTEAAPGQAPAESQAYGGEAGGLADNRMAAKSVARPAARAQAEADMPAQAQARDEEAKKEAAAGGEGKAKDATAGLYIIRRASLTLQVDEVKAGIKQVSDLMKRIGGFVAESAYESTEGSVPSARMVLRVPAEKFDAVLDSLSGVGKVFARNVDSDDVTLEFVDTTSRIRNLKQEESTLLKLLQRTGKLSEVLEMERELSRVRGEIEQAQGRLRHLGNQVSLATIEVSLSEKVQVANTSPWGHLPASFENAWQDAMRALAGAVDWMMRTGIWLLAYFLPLALPVVAIYLIAGWALRGWLIDRKKLMPDAWFVRFWVGLGLALLSLWWPPLAGIVVIAAIAAALLGAGSMFLGRFFVRKKDLD